MTTFQAGEQPNAALRQPRRRAAAADPERAGVVGERTRFDERDNVQSRGTLEPGSAEYEAFYARHPEWRRKDELIRALPGMGRVGSPLDTPMLGTQHDFLARLGMSDMVDGPVAPKRRSLSPERAAEKVKGFARHLGADLVRIGPLDPANVYTHVGKTWGDPARSWGQPIEVTHRNAISVAVGLSPAMLSTGPVLPEVVEVMRVYVRLATIAVTLASYVRALGYGARAQVMPNYQVLTVPVAIDAGMGELGRHGLMITKELGSALKLATVTTDLPMAYRPAEGHRRRGVLPRLPHLRRELPRRRHPARRADGQRWRAQVAHQPRGLLQRLEHDGDRLRRLPGVVPVDEPEDSVPPPLRRGRIAEDEGRLVDEPRGHARVRPLQAGSSARVVRSTGLGLEEVQAPELGASVSGSPSSPRRSARSGWWGSGCP